MRGNSDMHGKNHLLGSIGPIQGSWTRSLGFMGLACVRQSFRQQPRAAEAAPIERQSGQRCWAQRRHGWLQRQRRPEPGP